MANKKTKKNLGGQQTQPKSSNLTGRIVAFARSKVELRMQRARSRLYTAIFPTREGIIFPSHLFEVLRLVRKPVIVSFNSLLFLSLFSW